MCCRERAISQLQQQLINFVLLSPQSDTRARHDLDLSTLFAFYVSGLTKEWL